MNDVLIIGSGVSGVAAALRFVDRGIVPCILDVGIEERSSVQIHENFYSFRRTRDCFQTMIGDNFEGLRNLDRKMNPVPTKLSAPGMKFVIENATELSPVNEAGFRLIQSFAQGGFANAWGAGLYRYRDRDLRDFPIHEADLTPYYDRLTKEIGICGENDDLEPYFGRDDLLQKPLRLSVNASKILKNYHKNKENLNRIGVYVGRPRLGVLSLEKGGRTPCDYSSLEFWRPDLPYIYSPVHTLRRLIGEQKVKYNKGFFVRSWTRGAKGMVVQAESLEQKETSFFRCKKLVLAAGAVNSARLVLESNKDYRTRLTLLDNPALQFPFVLPARIGASLEVDAFGLTQLNLVYDLKIQNLLLQGSILEMTSPARAEFFMHFPLAAHDNLRFIRYLLPAMVVMQLFFPVDRANGASLSLNETGELEVHGNAHHFEKGIIKNILKLCRRLGLYAVPSRIVEVPSGHSIHYAGTLPMTTFPNKNYTCSKFGELYGEPDVHVVDGSLFPNLPAKNFSFATMANAMRIADHVAERLKG